MPFGITDVVGIGSGILNAVSGSSDEERAKKLQEQMLGINMADFEARLPLRGMAIDRILGPQAQRENLNGMFADSGNPYSRPMERPAPLPMHGQAGGPGGPVPLGGGSSLLPPATGTRVPLSMGDQYVNSIRPQLPSTQRGGKIDEFLAAGIKPGDGLLGRALSSMQRQHARGY
jgi:hypothetical protein